MLRLQELALRDGQGVCVPLQVYRVANGLLEVLAAAASRICHQDVGFDKPWSH